MSCYKKMIVSRSAAAAALIAAAWAGPASAQGFNEINQAIFDAAGGLPYVIDAPGLYRLTGNLNRPDVTVNQPMIRIDSDNVELDLGGFSMLGTGLCARNAFTGSVTCNNHQPGSGIQSSSGFENVVVRNGTVRGFFNGIVISGPNSRIERINTNQNAFEGVNAIGDGAQIIDVTSQRNGTNGITVQNNAVVRQCYAIQNDDYGILANQDSVISFSFAVGNRLGGMFLNPAAPFTQNTVSDNFGPDPVINGNDAGDNFCTNSSGQAVGC